MLKFMKHFQRATVNYSILAKKYQCRFQLFNSDKNYFSFNSMEQNNKGMSIFQYNKMQYDL